jgi:hypothetical protein
MRNEYEVLVGSLMEFGHFEDKDGEIDFKKHFMKLNNITTNTVKFNGSSK